MQVGRERVIMWCEDVFPRLPVSRIVAAIDDSAAARPVLGVASALAELLDAELDVLHVHEDGGSTAEAEAAAYGLALRVVEGPTVETILAEADRPDVVLLVIGARGMPLGKFAGSVAEAVISAATGPLVVVPPHVELPYELRRALVPLDGTRRTSEALEEVLQTACACGVHIVLLHVLDPSTIPFTDQPQHEVAAWEEEFLARYSPLLVRAPLELRLGTPARAIPEVAAEIGVDLIAIGWGQDLSPGRAAVVRHVLETAGVPVLLVPVAAEEEGAGERRARELVAGL